MPPERARVSGPSTSLLPTAVVTALPGDPDPSKERFMEGSSGPAAAAHLAAGRPPRASTPTLVSPTFPASRSRELGATRVLGGATAFRRACLSLPHNDGKD
ncbi:hypothetical protein GCM10017788_23920 [Amycolatopsis acidiphila]|nr:hypothetical protein GCM10017788_23920 [Amycolatopsis acidiphila]